MYCSSGLLNGWHGMAWHSMALYGCCCKHTISRNERYTRFTVGKSFFFSFYSRFSTSLFAFTQPPRECEHVFVFASWRYPIVCVHTENVWKRFCTRYTYRMLCCMPFVAVCFLFFLVAHSLCFWWRWILWMEESQLIFYNALQRSFVTIKCSV